jgi:transposase
MFDDAIKRVLKTTPYACINDLREEIENKLGLELAKETLIRRLKNLNYNYQKFSINKVEKDDDPNIIEQRRQYVRMQREVSAKKLPSFFYGICHLALD